MKSTVMLVSEKIWHPDTESRVAPGRNSRRSNVDAGARDAHSWCFWTEKADWHDSSPMKHPVQESPSYARENLQTFECRRSASGFLKVPGGTDPLAHKEASQSSATSSTMARSDQFIYMVNFAWCCAGFRIDSNLTYSVLCRDFARPSSSLPSRAAL